MLNWSVKKTIYLIVIVLGIATAVFFGFFYQASLVINITPAEAEILVAGSQHRSNEKIKLKPGSYEIKITSPNYITYEKSTSLKIGQAKTLNIDLRAKPGTVKALQNKISFLTSGENDKSLFYLANDGKTLYQLNKIDQATPEIVAITPDIFNNLTNVIFSPNRLLAILKKDANNYLYDFNRYDLLHQEINDWGTGIGEMIWSPDGEQIVYYFAPENGEITLIRSNRDKTEEERIYNFKDTSIRNPHLRYSLDGQKILVFTDKVYLFDVYSKALAEVKEAGKVIYAGFTPDSQNIILETIDGLVIMDFAGQNQIKLDINTQLNKLAWLDSTSFVYAKSNLGASDSFYKYNLKSKNTTEYFYNSEDTIIATDLVAVNNGQKIFFSNEGYLYSVNLTEKDY